MNFHHLILYTYTYNIICYHPHFFALFSTAMRNSVGFVVLRDAAHAVREREQRHATRISEPHFV